MPRVVSPPPVQQADVNLCRRQPVDEYRQRDVGPAGEVLQARKRVADLAQRAHQAVGHQYRCPDTVRQFFFAARQLRRPGPLQDGLGRGRAQHDMGDLMGENEPHPRAGFRAVQEDDRLPLTEIGAAGLDMGAAYRRGAHVAGQLEQVDGRFGRAAEHGSYDP